MFKNIQIADDFNEVRHNYIPENIKNDSRITFKKFNQSIFISDRTTNMQLSKMQIEI